MAWSHDTNRPTGREAGEEARGGGDGGVKKSFLILPLPPLLLHPKPKPRAKKWRWRWSVVSPPSSAWRRSSDPPSLARRYRGEIQLGFWRGRKRRREARRRGGKRSYLAPLILVEGGEERLRTIPRFPRNSSKKRGKAKGDPFSQLIPLPRLGCFWRGGSSFVGPHSCCESCLSHRILLLLRLRLQYTDVDALLVFV